MQRARYMIPMLVLMLVKGAEHQNRHRDLTNIMVAHNRKDKDAMNFRETEIHGKTRMAHRKARRQVELGREAAKKRTRSRMSRSQRADEAVEVKEADMEVIMTTAMAATTRKRTRKDRRTVAAQARVAQSSVASMEEKDVEARMSQGVS